MRTASRAGDGCGKRPSGPPRNGRSYATLDVAGDGTPDGTPAPAEAATVRSGVLKYLMMVQGTQADYDAMTGSPSPGSPAWTEADIETMFAFMREINDELAESGELVDGQGLAEPRKTRFVSLGEDGRPVVTDDPYGRTERLLAGYWVLDCAGLERVTEIAARVARCPQPEGAPEYPVVIRPIAESGEELTS